MFDYRNLHKLYSIIHQPEKLSNLGFWKNHWYVESHMSHVNPQSSDNSQEI